MGSWVVFNPGRPNRPLALGAIHRRGLRSQESGPADPLKGCVLGAFLACTVKSDGG